MKDKFQSILGKAKSATELAERLTKEGIRSVDAAWKGVGLRRSLSALSVTDLKKDETHYLLIPVLVEGSQREFVLYSKRVIPEGHGAVNSLPKERVFHLPDLDAERCLRKQLTSSLVVSQLEGADATVTLADRLEALAEDVDKETDKVSGGILLVGGLTTLINPIAGIGMIAGGVLPKLGGKLAKSGASLAGDQLRDWSEKRQKNKAAKCAESEVARLKPCVFVNPVLQKLEVALTNPSGVEDPLLERADWSAEFPNQRYFQVTREGVGEVFQTELDSQESLLNSPVRAWLRSLTE